MSDTLRTLLNSCSLDMTKSIWTLTHCPLGDVYGNNFKCVILQHDHWYLEHFGLNYPQLYTTGLHYKSILVQVIAWGHQATSHYLNQCYPVLCCHSASIINSLGPSDSIWQQRSGSTLAQVMACCLIAPSNYLNQCWLYIIRGVHWDSSEDNSIIDTLAITH